MKLQSAMEYLSTYGWAILIIAVVVGTLYAFGLFNPNTYTPKAQPGSCSIIRNSYGGASTAGVCNGQIPEFVPQFSGVFSSEIVIPSNSPPMNTMNTITVSAWIYPSSCTSGYCSFDSYATFLNGGSSSLTYNFNANKMLTYYVNIGGSAMQVSSAATVTPSNWYDVVFVYNGVYAAWFVNGVLSGTPSAASGSLASGSNSLIIGTGGYGSLDGYISNVQIYNTSLSANSIQALYQEGIGGVPINLRNLVGWWPLDGNANDYSGNGNNGAATSIQYINNWYANYVQP